MVSVEAVPGSVRGLNLRRGLEKCRLLLPWWERAGGIAGKACGAKVRCRQMRNADAHDCRLLILGLTGPSAWPRVRICAFDGLKQTCYIGARLGAWWNSIWYCEKQHCGFAFCSRDSANG